MEIQKSLEERRNHLEQLHRQAAAEASHGSEATQLQILFPDGIAKHLPQEAKDSFKKAADLFEEERKAEAAAKEADARPAKEAMELDEFGDLDDLEDSALDPRCRGTNRRNSAGSNQRRPREAGSLAGADGQGPQLAGSQEETETRVVPAEGGPPRSTL